MRRRRLVLVPLVLLAAALLLTACSHEHGTVRDKRFTPAHVMVSTMCGGGKVISCHPIVIPIADEWEIDVWASENDHGWVSVNEPTYNALHVGDYWQAKKPL